VLFSELGLKPEILRAIEERGYKEATPIQEKAIPYVLMGRDVLGCAQTGTGKTAGFCLPMLEILSSGHAKARMPRSLILEPTRELAAQVAESFSIYGKHVGLSVALLTGGLGMDEQIKKLERGVDVLIATPGRMLDLHERGNILLHDIKIFIIDEADRMLDMGFIPDIEKIGGLIPKIRQTLFFSATMPPEIRKLSERFLMNPKEISVSPPATTATTVEQAMVRVSDRQKREALRLLLRKHDFKSAFIFCNRKRDIAVLTESLLRHGFKADCLHGDMHQNKRNEALERFKTGVSGFLVCSDVAARGLDIKGVDAVFNFDVPFSAEDYVHRIGRTGRAGATGHAFMFVKPDDDKLLANVISLIKCDIPEVTLEGLASPPAMQEGESSGERRSGERGGRGGRGGRPDGRRERGGQRSTGSAPRREAPPQGDNVAPPPPHRQYHSERSENVQNRDRGQGLSNVVGFGDDMPAFLRIERQRPSLAAKEKASGTQQ
jgi:superfamily II DNA/RNA helicase